MFEKLVRFSDFRDRLIGMVTGVMSPGGVVVAGDTKMEGTKEGDTAADPDKTKDEGKKATAISL